MAKDVMIVLTNAVAGRDEEFNRWYDERHLADVLNGPFTAVERFRAADVEVGAPPPYRYLALYEIEDGKAEEARDWILWSRAERAEALAAGREPQVPMNDAMAEERVSWFFRSIGERVEASAQTDALSSG
jgi:hypothetical protein